MEVDQLVFSGLTVLSTVSILLIATMGLAVVFGMMGVVNLAHGEFIMFGAYITLFLVRAGLPFPLAVGCAAVVLALYGALLERMIISRLYGRLIDTLLATWGVSLIMYQGAILIFGSYTSGIGLPRGVINVGRYSMSSYFLFLILFSFVLAGIVYFVFARTRYGVMSRAAIQDPMMANSIGVSTSRLNTITFAIGSALAGLAGGLLVPAFPATPDMGVAFVSKGFLAVVSAGPLIITGTISALLGIGGISSLGGMIFTSVVGDLFFFVITILVLRIFPMGLTGGKSGKL